MLYCEDDDNDYLNYKKIEKISKLLKMLQERSETPIYQVAAVESRRHLTFFDTTFAQWNLRTKYSTLEVLPQQMEDELVVQFEYQYLFCTSIVTWKYKTGYQYLVCTSIVTWKYKTEYQYLVCRAFE